MAIVLGLNNALGTLLPLMLFHPDQLVRRTGLTLVAGLTMQSLAKTSAVLVNCSW